MTFMYRVGVKIIGRVKGRDSSVRIEKHTDRRQALESMDFVVVTIGVGGVDATHTDIEVPRRYDTEQTVGDTVVVFSH